jgi:hypothetical protein
MKGTLVKRKIKSVLLLTISLLGLAFYFSVWPFSSADAFMAEIVNFCAGSEVEDPMRHACGLLDPRNLIIFPVVNLVLLLIGVFMWFTKRVEDSPEISDPS